MIPPTRLSYSYTCWQCLARGRTKLTPPTSLRRVGVGACVLPKPQSLPSTQSRHHATKRKGRGRSADADALSFDPSAYSAVILAIRREAGVKDGEQVKFRNLLEIWEGTRPAPDIVQLMPDDSPDGTVANLHNRTGVPDGSELRLLEADSGHSGHFGDEMQEGGGGGGHAAEPGDLVEIRTPNSRLPVLAVYLGFLGSNYHFYTSTGQWRFMPAYVSCFSVPGFVHEAAIAPIVANIPRAGSSETYMAMEQARLGPSRADAGAVLDRMSGFLADAERVYQANISVLGNSHRQVADPEKFRFMTLSEIASQVLPHSSKELPNTSLYAVHLALMRVDGGVRPLQQYKSKGKRDFLFEIAPESHFEILRSAQAWTRRLVATITANAGNKVEGRDAEKVLMKNPLYQFLSKARLAVQASRAHREPTSHAMVGVFRREPDGAMAAKTPPAWSGTDEQFIRFFEMWAAYGNFGAGSSLHSAGSLLLRFLGCYPDIEFLSNSVAWLFLQEIGWMPPYELPTRYRAKLPGTSVERGGALVRHAPDGLDTSLRDDVAEGHRKDWGSTPVLCIDSRDTSLVDDGISLERTDRDDEFWIHAHIADPTSGIAPDSDLLRYMQLMPENIWLEGYYEDMLPKPSGGGSAPTLSEKYSLAPGARCLTFSTKVNRDGKVLDRRIEPGTVNNVIYLDTEEVTAKFRPKTAMDAPPHSPMAVGTAPPRAKAARAITAIPALSADDRADLQTLSELSARIYQRRIDEGAWPQSQLRPKVHISHHGVSKNESTGRWEGDPYIKIGWDTNILPVVSTPMQLAGELAAKWCSKRGVPIPYRKDSAQGRSNISRASEFVRSQVYPRLEAGLPLQEWHLRTLVEFVGYVTNSPTPGSAFRMGLDMYSRVTSPLRRLTDMLAHWQIHAALALERQLGRPVTPDDIAAAPASRGSLPFSLEVLEDMLRDLSMRSRIIRRLNTASDEWVLQALVRAWKFGQATLPPFFKFTITGVGRQALVGDLDWFSRRAVMKVEHLGEAARLNDVREGDQFQVELQDVNVHTRIINVKALRRIAPNPDTQGPE